MTGSWFSSPTAVWTFSPEHRRLEGDGLEEACGTGRKQWRNMRKDTQTKVSEQCSPANVLLPLSMTGSLITLLVSVSGSLALLTICLFAAFGLSAIFFCKFSLRALVRSSSFCWGKKKTLLLSAHSCQTITTTYSLKYYLYYYL